MSNQNNDEHNEEAPGKNKSYTIVINGVQVTTDEHKLTYEGVLALQNLPVDTENPYLVSYARGPHGNSKGDLAPGESLVIKDGVVFNVSPSNKS